MIKKINWKVRAKNPYFWTGLVCVILAAIGVSPESITSWPILWAKIMELLNNPFALGCMAMAIIGYINDPTTKGLKDSNLALTYEEPKED